MRFSLGRLAPVFLAVALAAGLFAFTAPASSAAVGWENPSRHLTVTDPNGGSLRPGDTVQAALTGFTPSATAQLAVCLDDVFIYDGAVAPNDKGCTPRTPIAVDPTGAASVSYVIPADLQVTLAGKCGLLSFAYYGACSVIAFEGAPLVSVADAPLTFTGLGTAAVGGHVINDATGTPVTTSHGVTICGDGGSNCSSATTTTGAYNFTALPAGNYSVSTTPTNPGPSFPDPAPGPSYATPAPGGALSFGFDPDPSFSFGTNTVGVAAADGANVANVDVPIAPTGAETGPIGYRGASISVTRPSPEWNQTVTITSGGFRPGHQVNIGLCPTPISVAIQAGNLTTCSASTVTADGSGNATLVLPYTPARFQNSCPSLVNCAAVAHEKDFDGKGRWAITNFSPPSGPATIQGTVTVNGAPVTSIPTISVCGPVGCRSVVGDGSGMSFGSTATFSIPAPANGDYTITAKSYVNGHQLTGSKTVTVSNNQSVTGVDVALDASTLPTGSISGTIKDTTGDPIPGITVSGCKLGTGVSCTEYGQASGDSQGRYSMLSLTDGTWRLTAAGTGVNVPDFSQLVTVSNGAPTIADLVLPVDIGTGALRVITVDLHGSPVLSASISVCGPGSTGGCRTLLTNSGSAIVSNLPDGIFGVSATSSSPTTSPVSVSVTGGQLVYVTVTLPLVIGGGSIAGTIRDAGGTPTNANLTFCADVPLPAPGQGCNALYTGISGGGTYLRPNLPDGTYRVTASPAINPALQASTTVTITAGAHLTGVDLTLPTAPVVDTTAPTIKVSNPLEGGSFPRGASATATFGCTDTGGSGLKTCVGTVANGAPIDTATLGAKTFTVDATDNADNHSATTVHYSVVDVTAPTATATVNPIPNAAGWVKATAIVTLQATDEAGGSGLVSLTLGAASGATSPLTTTVSTDGTTVVPYTASDVAGNVTSGSVTVKLDRSVPTISITSPTAATVAQGTAVTAAYTCADAAAGSGVATCTGSIPNGGAIDTSTPGVKTLTVTATDNAGNTATATRSITVTAVNPPAGRDHVAARFTGAIRANYDAALTGQVTFKKTKNLITSATATGTVPGAAGGTATIKVSVARLWTTSLFLGTITVTDPSTRLSQTTPILGNVTVSGSTVSGTSSWFTSRLAPYSLKWAITDAG